MEQKYHDLVLALAGIFQAASLVRDLAKTGTTDEAAFVASINTIYKLDSSSVLDIYGNPLNLRIGLTELIRLLSNDKTATDAYIGRYVISMLHLERKLMRDKKMLDTLTRRLKHATSQANYFSHTHPTVIASLADIYINTLGTLSFRLHILGQAKFLNQTEIINKIRAILLAGIRSAVLWRQIGGNRWQLFLQRTKLANVAKQLIQKT